MSKHAYLFEIRSIQSLLFANGRLKDMVAGSEMIDYLCSTPLKIALQACGADDRNAAEHSPRAAGGAAYLLFNDADSRNRFAALWPVFVEQWLPTVELVDARADGSTARDVISMGINCLTTARNRRSSQLPAGPLVERDPRTGEAAFGRGDDHAFIDAATQHKRWFKRPDGGLVRRFSERSNIHWPSDFTESAPLRNRFHLRDSGLVGLVHADGNGLGEVLRTLHAATEGLSDADYISVYRSFSDGLERATCAAAAEATEKVLIPEAEIRCKDGNHGLVIAARPLVLGGDDLTIIVRDDLAVPYTRAFIESFEVRSGEFLNALRAQLNTLGRAEQGRSLPEFLTACAGISYMKSSTPFAQVYTLTENLCSAAKKASRAAKGNSEGAIPSSIRFHRLHSTLIDDAERLFEQEMVLRPGHGAPSTRTWKDSIALGLAAYGLGKVPSTLPTLDALQSLVQQFASSTLNAKRLRSLITLLAQSRDLAVKDYERWRQLGSRNAKRELAEFDSALKKLLSEVDAKLPMRSAVDDEPARSPLMDALVMLNTTQVKTKEHVHHE